MKYWFDVGMSVLFGFLSAASLLGMAGTVCAIVVCLIDLFVETSIDVGLWESVRATVVLTVVFIVSSRLFMYFSKEKFS